jgi:hypothetical protein
LIHPHHLSFTNIPFVFIQIRFEFIFYSFISLITDFLIWSQSQWFNSPKRPRLVANSTLPLERLSPYFPLAGACLEGHRCFSRCHPLVSLPGFLESFPELTDTFQWILASNCLSRYLYTRFYNGSYLTETNLRTGYTYSDPKPTLFRYLNSSLHSNPYWLVRLFSPLA